jgi:2-polyprenyl-3-methyl-5-hydroxy-6-metoxy-1,4-benzoquinol methylase
MMAETLTLDFPACIARQFPDVFAAAWSATEDILATLDGVDFSALARHSRGLLGYEWSAYHRCNLVRAARVATVIRDAGVRAGRVLDFGSYFGNFSLMLRRLGFEVDAVDDYRRYTPAFDRVQSLLRLAGVTIRDFEDEGHDLRALPAASSDVILCLGVIEHIPHSPKAMLDALTRVLKPGGLLVLDTPNLAYLYRREALAQGRSIFPPIADQFLTDPPFEGHHREYTTAEVRWMLAHSGYEAITIETFDFSVYALGTLEGETLDKYRRTQADPDLRELILASARKPQS